jgi:hypothetical protein
VTWRLGVTASNRKKGADPIRIGVHRLLFFLWEGHAHRRIPGRLPFGRENMAVLTRETSCTIATTDQLPVWYEGSSLAELPQPLAWGKYI